MFPDSRADFGVVDDPVRLVEAGRREGDHRDLGPGIRSEDDLRARPNLRPIRQHEDVRVTDPRRLCPVARPAGQPRNRVRRRRACPGPRSAVPRRQRWRRARSAGHRAARRRRAARGSYMAPPGESRTGSGLPPGCHFPGAPTPRSEIGRVAARLAPRRSAPRSSNRRPSTGRHRRPRSPGIAPGRRVDTRMTEDHGCVP